MPNDEDQPDGKDWPGVIKAIQNRMKAEHISDAELARRTRLTPDILAKIWIADSTFAEADLVNISAMLGWHPHYLVNILERRPHENTVFGSSAEEAFKKRTLDWLALIDRKLDRIRKDQDHADGSG